MALSDIYSRLRLLHEPEAAQAEGGVWQPPESFERSTTKVCPPLLGFRGRFFAACHLGQRDQPVVPPSTTVHIPTQLYLPGRASGLRSLQYWVRREDVYRLKMALLRHLPLLVFGRDTSKYKAITPLERGMLSI